MKCYLDFAVASFFRLNRIALYFTEQRSARKTNAKKSLDLSVIRKTDKMSIQSQPTPCSLKTEKKPIELGKMSMIAQSQPTQEVTGAQ